MNRPISYYTNHPQYFGRVLFPADILLRIRERGEISHLELLDELAIRPIPSDFRNSHLLHILRDLEEADLIEVLGSLPKNSHEDFYHLRELKKSCIFRVTPHLQILQTALQLSLHRLRDDCEMPHVEAADRVRQVVEDLKGEMPDVGYKADTIATFRELGTCLQTRCYIATLALGGKLLELVVKHHMLMTGQSFEDNWMLGTLLQKMKENADIYQDPSLRNVANIINTSRIPAVHAKREIPIPSEEQALMVVNAVLDVTRRLVLTSQSRNKD